MSALGDGFRKHPIALSIIGLFAVSSIGASLAQIFDDGPLPEKMTCEIAEQAAGARTTSTLRLEFGMSYERQNEVSIPAEDLQRLGRAPVRFACRAG